MSGICLVLMPKASSVEPTQMIELAHWFINLLLWSLLGQVCGQQT